LELARGHGTPFLLGRGEFSDSGRCHGLVALETKSGGQPQLGYRSLTARDCPYGGASTFPEDLKSLGLKPTSQNVDYNWSKGFQHP